MEKVENPFKALVDAYLATTAAALESTLTSKEFLELSRHSLELMCGHRDRSAAMTAEFLGIPARPETSRKTKKTHGRRKR